MEAILATDISGGISKNGLIPWKSKKDMSFFFNKTKNNVVIMGKTTYFSLPEQYRPLKDRLNIVLTKEPSVYLNDEKYNQISNLFFTNDEKINEFIFSNREKYLIEYPFLSRDFKIYIIGGKQIYDKYIPLCESVWVTTIKKEYECDLFFSCDYQNLFKERKYFEDEELVIIHHEKIYNL